MSKASSPIEPILCIANRLEAIANKFVFGPMNLSPMSVKILSALSRKKNTTPSDLLKIASSTKSNISQRLTFLEKEGLICRKNKNESLDKRSVIISITPAGTLRLKEMNNRLKKAKLQLGKHFSSEEISQHVAFLKKMHSLLDIEEDELRKLFPKIK